MTVLAAIDLGVLAELAGNFFAEAVPSLEMPSAQFALGVLLAASAHAWNAALDFGAIGERGDEFGDGFGRIGFGEQQIPVEQAGLGMSKPAPCVNLMIPLCLSLMPARVSEAIVLQTYPLKESDLIVSFLTRDAGKLRGVAKRARRPKSAFGAGLERLSEVKVSYYQRENRELVNLDSCDLVHSQFKLSSDYYAAVSLDYFAEISEQLLPADEPSERYFRLLQTVLEHLRAAEAGSVWRAATYFSLWAVRLAGMLPELHVCLGCGTWLDDPEQPERAFFIRGRNGLFCAHCRGTLSLRGAWELTAESRLIANDMLQHHIQDLAPRQWVQSIAADLRKFLVQQIETHIERKLITVALLEAA